MQSVEYQNGAVFLGMLLLRLQSAFKDYCQRCRDNRLVIIPRETVHRMVTLAEFFEGLAQELSMNHFDPVPGIPTVPLSQPALFLVGRLTNGVGIQNAAEVPGIINKARQLAGTLKIVARAQWADAGFAKEVLSLLTGAVGAAESIFEVAVAAM